MKERAKMECELESGTGWGRTEHVWIQVGRWLAEKREEVQETEVTAE